MIPCLNEEITIGKVVRDFLAALPEAEVHVFDNNSTDSTREEAISAGATVHFVAQRGKGNVVRAMFRNVEADFGVMVDGDDSYPASQVRELLAPVIDGRAEMAIGTRLQGHDAGAFRPLHMFGNKLVLVASNFAFGARSTDMLSGYRAFSLQFMKSMPVLSRGFEIETEMTLHAADHGLATIEIPIRYGTRPAGSSSKLNTFRDGYRVLRTILILFKDWRPLAFFGSIAALMALVGVLLGIGVVREFLEYERVVGVARAVACVAALVIALLSLTTGLILDTVNRRTRELHLLLAGLLQKRPR